jgi:hypothetical protein
MVDALQAHPALGWQPLHSLRHASPLVSALDGDHREPIADAKISNRELVTSALVDKDEPLDIGPRRKIMQGEEALVVRADWPVRLPVAHVNLEDAHWGHLHLDLIGETVPARNDQARAHV